MTHRSGPLPLILASASPRRQEMLRLLGVPFQVYPAAVAETRLPGESPEALVSRLSRLKADWVAHRAEGLILAADTVVVLDGRILGKPRDVNEARTMLLSLRDRWHLVYTAFTLLRVESPGNVLVARTVIDVARVHIRPFTTEALEAYLATGDPLDKAGGYAIQHREFAPVDAVEGCRATVMGLPVHKLVPLLAAMGGPEPRNPRAACEAIFGTCCWGMEDRRWTIDDGRWMMDDLKQHRTLDNTRGAHPEVIKEQEIMAQESRLQLTFPEGYNGIVARVRGPVADVLLADGQVVPAVPRGVLKRERRGTLIAVGDYVRVAQAASGDWRIEEIAPRERALVRRAPNTLGRLDVIVSNPDQACFMFAVRDPHPRLQMLDRLLVIAEDNDIPAAVIVNKIDLDETGEAQEIFAEYEEAGYPVFYISVETGEGVGALRDHFRDKITVLAGPSGVGKSSLINVLEPSVRLPTAAISRKWRQGRHTTVMAQLIPLRDRGYIVDTPGLREVGLWGVDVDNLDYYFPEFRPYLGECRFNDCRHLDEPGCAILAAVEAGEISFRRYESYVNILLSEGG